MKTFLFKPKIQVFYRRIGNECITVTSGTYIFANHFLPRPISILADQHINELLFFLDQGKIVINDLEYICGTKYIPWAFRNIQHIKTPVFFMSSNFAYAKRREYSKHELISPKFLPDYYTENEENIISNMDIKSFFEWFRHDINITLKYIFGYKRSDVEFEFPKNLDEVKRKPYITTTTNISDLEKELELLYQRTIIILSLVFVEDLSLSKVKKRLMNEVRFIKQLMFALTEELDRNFIRVRNFVFNYRKLERNGLYIENFYEPLTKILLEYECEIDTLKIEASNYFNLQYS